MLPLAVFSHMKWLLLLVGKLDFYILDCQKRKKDERRKVASRQSNLTTIYLKRFYMNFAKRVDDKLDRVFYFAYVAKII